MIGTGIMTFEKDSLERYWAICPYCKKKTPAWLGRERVEKGFCRWCGQRWEISRGRDTG